MPRGILWLVLSSIPHHSYHYGYFPNLRRANRVFLCIKQSVSVISLLFWDFFLFLCQLNHWSVVGMLRKKRRQGLVVVGSGGSQRSRWGEFQVPLLEWWGAGSDATMTYYFMKFLVSVFYKINQKGIVVNCFSLLLYLDPFEMDLWSFYQQKMESVSSPSSQFFELGLACDWLWTAQVGIVMAGQVQDRPCGLGHSLRTLPSHHVNKASLPDEERPCGAE